MILDAGPLIAIDRGEHAARAFVARALDNSAVLRTTAPVVAQVWRNGHLQARLARLLDGVEHFDFTRNDARDVGELLRRTRTADVVDAHIVVLAARLGDGVLTTDAGDLAQLASDLGHLAPQIYGWPPN